MTKETELGTSRVKQAAAAAAEKIGSWKIRTKMVLLLLVMAVVSISLFVFLWRHQADAADLLERSGIVTWFDAGEFLEKAESAAKYYNVPESEDDEEGKKAFEPFLDLMTDDYTGVSIYGIDDGLYRYGRIPNIMDHFIFGSLLASSQIILGEQYGDVTMEFANGTYDLIYYSYHRSRFTYPYFIASIILCVAVFLSGILIFLGRMMRRVFAVKDSIVRMSVGDLTSPVPPCGADEIGIVAKELDTLRRTLQENIRRESESRQANQDLITAMSHDLRTPLTVLNGYLEVLKLKRADPDAQEKYVERCLEKATDIKALTDRMFEYALVYEENETADLEPLPVYVLAECLRENCEFIRIAGFTVEEKLQYTTESRMYGDEIMLKRIFSNLFSNILKYGDKKGAVTVQICPECGRIKVMITNLIKKDAADTESNQIGLRSVRKMVEMHQGELYTFVETNIYTVSIVFELIHKCSRQTRERLQE